MSSITLLAHAKINLTLDVVRRLPNGYHEVDMILQSLSLADEVTLTALPEEPGVIRLTVENPEAPGEDIPADARNLAYRAAALLAKGHAFPAGLSIRLVKHVPAAAGLAGGSADAAAVLAGTNRLFSLGLTEEDLAAYGVRLGADIPFCLTGGTRRARGIGEKLEILPAMPACTVLLAKPAEGVSTAAVYGALSIGTRPPYPHVATEDACRALHEGDLEALCGACGNLLQEVTQPMLPVIGELAEHMKEHGALAALMSGSGPTVYGIFTDAEAAGEAARSLPEGIRRAVTAPAAAGLSLAAGPGRSTT